MNRENLITRLVERKMASGTAGQRGCVPCFGRLANPTAPNRTAQSPKK